MFQDLLTLYALLHVATPPSHINHVIIILSTMMLRHNSMPLPVSCRRRRSGYKNPSSLVSRQAMYTPTSPFVFLYSAPDSRAKFFRGIIRNMSDLAALEQPTLLDLSGQELNAMWVDEGQPLFIANNPRHWKAHKLQIHLARLEKQADRNPAQFNATAYITTLNEYTKIMEEIKSAKVLDESAVDSQRAEQEAAAEMGDTVAPRLDTGVSADNPLAR